MQRISIAFLLTLPLINAIIGATLPEEVGISAELSAGVGSGVNLADDVARGGVLPGDGDEVAGEGRTGVERIINDAIQLGEVTAAHGSGEPSGEPSGGPSGEVGLRLANAPAL